MEAGNFDLVPFGTVEWWSAGEGAALETHVMDLSRPLQLQGEPPHLGVEWDEPRDIARLVVRCDGNAPRADNVRVEYWRNHWPGRDPQSYQGSYRAWMGQDDPFHGTWTVARGDCSLDDHALIFEFDPLDTLELPGIEDLERRKDYLARFRRTLKIRLVAPGGFYVADLEAYSAARTCETLVQVEVPGRGRWEPVVTAFNGYVESCQVTREEPDTTTVVVAVRGTNAGSSSWDATLLTFREPSPPEGEDPLEFTVRASDLRDGPLWIRDLGVYVTERSAAVPLQEYRRRVESVPRQPIYDRVRQEPEQTYERAVRDIPELDIAGHPPYGRYVVLGPEAGQLKFGLRYNGEVFLGKRLLRLSNRLTSRLRWPGNELHLRLGTGDPPDFRERNGASRQWREAGYLPVIHTSWHDRDIYYEQVAFATLLEGRDAPWEQRNGDEAPVLMTVLTARNATTEPRRACVWLHISPDEALTVDDSGNVLAQGYVSAADYPPQMATMVRYDAPVLRAIVRARGGADGSLRATSLASSGATATTPNAVLYEVELDPGESIALEIGIPLFSYSDVAAWDALARLDLEAERQNVADLWDSVARGRAVLRLPESIQDLDDFVRAVPSHILISAFRDPLTRHLVVPAGAFTYGSCGNEGAWQTVALDILGQHERARAYLMSFLHTQGLVRPDGAFQSAEGALQAMDFDQGRPRASMFSYNLDHGTILEAVLFHYRITGDRDWLTEIAPHLVAACDFVTRERAATAGDDARTRGLLPPGHLEDNPEWRYWFAVNAHAYGGMKATAEALADIGHTDAERISRDADAFRRDILTAVREARVQAPVVRLSNGVAVPHVPTRAQLRGREWGWIREVGYGPLHLWDGRLLDPASPEVTWILQDLEDNLFVTRDFGYGIDVDREWFSLGGVTPQPNLLNSGIAYLERDQIEHAVRALYNNVVLGLYRDVRVMAEWVSRPGMGGGPFYKPSDEARVVTWLRHHLVFEEGTVLWLAKGAPREWYCYGQSFGVTDAPTFFGQVSYTVESHLAWGEMRAVVQLRLRRQPDSIRLRFRHPERRPIRCLRINGVESMDRVDGEAVTLPVHDAGEHRIEIVVTYQEKPADLPAGSMKGGATVDA